MGDTEAVAADATVGPDATAATAAYFVPDASDSGDKSSFGSESAVQGSSTVQEASISVDHQADHGTPISESMYATTENGSISAEAQTNSSAISTEEDRLWSMVRSNGSDFNSWTALIQETERVAEDNIEKVRRVYDAFLEEFPLCYGYWKKYADHEAQFGAIDKVVEVYERAVLAVTYSVDIWLHYCGFAIGAYGDPDIIRRLFERGLAYVGTDYLSAPLWDKYIEYEYSHQQWRQLALIYTRILENPIQQLDRYYNSFKELAAHMPLSEILSVEDAAAMESTISEDTNGREGSNEENHDADDQSSPKSLSSGLTEAEKLERYLSVREEMYKKAKEFDSKIIDFETAIRRPYFHVRPLDEAQLENWHNYLDFIETLEDFNKVVKLYERCLISCANYPEYWIRYVLFMEISGSLDLATNALARATQVFVKRQPEIHLFAARFKEQMGDISGARAEYHLIYKELSLNLLEAIIKHANMEYRLGNAETAYNVFEEAIATERQKDQSQMLPILYLQYSRFLLLVAGNVDKAKAILDTALEHVSLSKHLLEAVIHLESIQTAPKRIEYLDLLVEKFVTSNSDGADMTSSLDREELSSIFLEFLDLFGDSQAMKKAENRHAKLFLRQKTASMLRKRNAANYMSSEKAKYGRSSNAPSLQSNVGAYPSSQSQWSGVQPQAWPLTSQAQGQQWNASYAQQATYPSYPGYNGYTQPQGPSSAPQAASYGVYAPYPGQALPPQTYAQSTLAFTPGQPQSSGAPTQASYYGY